MKNKLMKKVVTLALAATLALSTVCTAFAAGSPTAETPAEPVKQTSVKAQNGATVATTAKGTASVKTIKKTTKTTVTLPSAVKVNGVAYKVTTVEAKAFKNATKVKTITLPNTVTTIKASAFATNKKLTKVTLKSKKAVNVSKDAFKGLTKKQKSKIVIYYNKSMSKSQINKLKKALKKAGISTKNIKAKKM